MGGTWQAKLLPMVAKAAINLLLLDDEQGRGLRNRCRLISQYVSVSEGLRHEQPRQSASSFPEESLK